MDQFKKNLAVDLKKHKITEDYSKIIDELLEKGILKEGMPYKALFNTFLIHMGKKSKLFENVLKNKYVFDLTCHLDSKCLDPSWDDNELECKLKKSFLNRIEYSHIERKDSKIFIGLKFSKDIYSEIKNSELEEYLYPYKLLLFDKAIKIADYTFDQLLFTYEKPQNIKIEYAEFIEHLKTLKLPLSITSDDLLFENTCILPIYDAYIYLESSSQWPKDQEAIDCAKTAFYCQLYTKSKYRHAINKEYCVFKYKNVFFKVKILIKQDFNQKYKILMGLGSIIKSLNADFYRKVHMAKSILAKLGFYPLQLDDFFIDIVCLIVWNNSIGDSKFIEDFLNFNFNIFGCSFDLSSLKVINEELGARILKMTYKDTSFNYILPDIKLIAEIKAKLSTLKINANLFNDDFILQTDHLFEPKLDEYDIILSKKSISGFTEVIGSIVDCFDLGTVEFKEFTNSSIYKMASFYYNPLSMMLFIKAKPGVDVDLLANLVVLETSFEYIKIN